MFSQKPRIKWKKVRFDKANAAYDFETAHDGMSAGESFPEDEPDFGVFKGDITVDGSALFGAEDEDDCTMFVIDGNLTVRGPLCIGQGDLEGFLYVTGNVVCDDCVILTDAHVSVGGSLEVKNLLVTDLSDLGTLFVKGALRAGTWIDGSARSTLKLGLKPVARMLCVPGTPKRDFGADAGPLSHSFDPTVASDVSSALVPEFFSDGELDAWAIREALLAKAPVLRGA